MGWCNGNCHGAQRLFKKTLSNNTVLGLQWEKKIPQYCVKNNAYKLVLSYSNIKWYPMLYKKKTANAKPTKV